jgi:uncharacterized protein
MLFALICIDKPFSQALRMVTREAHLAYVAASGATVAMAGPFLSEDGARMTGSLIVLDMPDLAAAEAWAAEDPYAKAGLFGSVEIRPWRFAIQNGVPRAAPVPQPAGEETDGA